MHRQARYGVRYSAVSTSSGVARGSLASCDRNTSGWKPQGVCQDAPEERESSISHASLSGPPHMQEAAEPALPHLTTRRDGHQEFHPRPYRVFHAQHAVEIRSGKSGRLVPQEHEWGCRASARSDRARRRPSRLARVAVPGWCAARPEARHAESTFAHRI